MKNKESLIGKKFGMLLVLEEISKNLYKCLCDCENIKEIKYKSLKRGTKSCGCLVRKNYKLESFVGKRFGKLIVIKEETIGKDIMCECKCDCGEKKTFKKAKIINKKARSCGCHNKRRNIIGKIIGKLTVIKQIDKNNFECKCECENIVNFGYKDLSQNRVKTCGCSSKDLIGKKFNKLTVLEKCKTKWKCLCECGNIKFASTNSLETNHTKSCGCLRYDNLKSFIGKTNNKLKVIEIKNNKLLCFCECGNKKSMNINKFLKSKSCGCMENARKREPKITCAIAVYNERYKDGDISFEDFLKLTQENCFYCDKVPSSISRMARFSMDNKEHYFIYNGLDRKDNSQKHNLNNIVTCCADCNVSKKYMNFNEFIEKIKNIYNEFILNQKEIIINDFDKRKEFINTLINTDINLNDLSLKSAKSAYNSTYKRNKGGNLSFIDFVKISQNICFYCNSGFSNKSNFAKQRKIIAKEEFEKCWFYYNGLDRIDSNLMHDLYNCVPCCKYCNMIKSNKKIMEFSEFVKKVYFNLKNKGEI